MMANKLKSLFKTPEIEFLCEPEDYGVIPEPFPSRKFLPDWYKALPSKRNKENTLENGTLKRCPPFLDAMTVGWIIPLVSDVEIISNGDASGINYKWNFYKTVIENHTQDQITTQESPNPNLPKPPLKFLNYWYIKVPKGWSVLFVPPINRPDPRFTCLSGLVDVDGYHEYINFPFFFNQPNYTGILKAGTPLVQAIPIKRSNICKDYSTRVVNKKEKAEIELTRRKRTSRPSLYRETIWERK